MLETREQSARLVGPFCGDVSVDRNTPICIRFCGEDLNKSDINIKISGENAIINGQESRGYEIMDLLENDKYIYIKFRKIGGLKKGEIFVFGKCGNCFTKEQRFFISGSSTNYNNSGLYHEFKDYSSDWIHVSESGNETSHSHKKIPENHPVRNIKMKIDDIDKNISWERIFISDECHVWWNSNSIITRSNIDIFRSISEDILWTTKDIGVDEIRSVRPIGKYSIVVNEKKRINYSIIEVLSI